VNYAAYGLVLHSELHLPELPKGRGPADVRIRLNGEVGPLGNGGHVFRAGGNLVRLVFEQVGVFLIRDGKEILVTPLKGVPEPLLRRYVWVALGVLFSQRGLLLLHASAAAMGSGAVAFLGGSGWGKSTTVAALCARGHALLAEEIVAIRLEGNQVLPAFPQIRLWPDAVRALGLEARFPDPLPPGVLKHSLRSDLRFSRHARPLRRLYVLADGPRVRLIPLSPREGFVALLSHLCSRRIIRVKAVSSFPSYAACARQVRALRLERPQSLEVLDEVVEAVERDLAS
jgi:hypothetical protein